jgi:hypothetical protein
LLPTTGLYSRHQRNHVLQVEIAAFHSIPLSPSFNFLFLQILHKSLV